MRLSNKQIAARGAVVAAIIGIAAMWVYAFVFASKDAAAGLDDKSWAQRAEQICVQRNALIEQNVATYATSDQSIAAQHDAYKRATDFAERALDEVVAVQPNNARDQRLVNEWARIYRINISDRRATEAELAAGKRVEPSETMLNGDPVTETITDFTSVNKMDACAAPSN